MISRPLDQLLVVYNCIPRDMKHVVAGEYAHAYSNLAMETRSFTVTPDPKSIPSFTQHNALFRSMTAK